MASPEMEWTELVNRHARYNASQKGQARRRDYRHSRSKWETDASYLSRDFVMWDGEGITRPDGSHIYVMFGHSKGGFIANPDGLHTMDLLHFTYRECKKYAGDIHVIYGGSYDANMWLGDMSQETIGELYTHDYYRWRGLTVQWRRGKSFYIRDDNVPKPKGVTLYDVVSFFQTSFVNACDQYLGDRFTDRDLIVKNKALRSDFKASDIPEMKQYMLAELDNGVKLMTELRERLNKVGLRPRRWDGPGAVAAALLTRENVKASKAECPPAVAEAGRYAYFGGRFEVIQYGAVRSKAYEYDVNSAYPHGLRFVPNLSRGEWVQSFSVDPGDVSADTFGVYHARFKGADFRLPQPLPWRSYRGNIVYPGDNGFYGWYWAPDIVAAREYVRRYGGTLELTSGWVFEEENRNDRPFAFIPELYAERSALKARGDGAHVGIKLALNSLYGKLAQQVGARPDGETGKLIPPPFHQLEWAGYVTSMCRSMVYLAAIDDLSKVIAYETDALFTTEPLAVPLGTGLGEWDYTEFHDLTYVQSGLYFGSLPDGTGVAKTRGVNRGTLDRTTVESRMYAAVPDERVATAPLTQFITAGLALQGRWHDWRRWITSEKNLKLEPQGKRVPLELKPLGEWSRTFAARVPTDSHSAEFPIMWINPNEGMEELEELRNMGGAEYYDLMDGFS